MTTEMTFGDVPLLDPLTGQFPAGFIPSGIVGSATDPERIRYINVWDGFFEGKDSDAQPDIWLNSSHLNPVGQRAWADYIVANAGIVGAAPKVVWFGDSWVEWNPEIFTDATHAVIPGAVVVTTGVAGNTSAAMLARFNADIPADADYVIFNEPGVNDVYQNVAPAVQQAQLAKLTEKILALGAVPVYTGHAPLSEQSTRGAARHAETVALIGEGVTFPAVPFTAFGPVADSAPNSPNASSLAIGGGLRSGTVGVSNTAVGKNAGRDNTTGIQNTTLGDSAGAKITTGNSNIAVGASAGQAVTTGSGNIAIGASALVMQVTGGDTVALGKNTLFYVTSSGNVAIGAGAGYLVNGSTAKATTSGYQNVFIGPNSGGGPSSSYGIALGSSSEASGTYSLAIGYKALASAHGAVAIGADSGGVVAQATTANRFVLGTVNHRYQMPGLPTTNPGAESGILWNDDGVVKVA